MVFHFRVPAGELGNLSDFWDLVFTPSDFSRCSKLLGLSMGNASRFVFGLPKSLFPLIPSRLKKPVPAIKRQNAVPARCVHCRFNRFCVKSFPPFKKLGLVGKE